MRKCVLLIIVALGACARSEAQHPTPPGNQFIIAVDLSGSQSDDKRSQAHAVAIQAIKQLSNGDEIVILQVHQGSVAEDGAVRWRETIPAVRRKAPTQIDREQVAKVQRAANSVLAHLFKQDTAGAIPTTDLLSTLHIVSDFRRESGPRRPILLVLSDMIQSANGIEMWRGVGVPPQDWIVSQRTAGLIPDLSNVCISVVGAEVATPAGLKIREFWKSYFAATGATLPADNYRLISVGNPVSRCTAGAP